MGIQISNDKKEEMKEDRAPTSGTQIPLTTEPEDKWFTGCTESISSLSFATLNEGVYLNDEVINTYIAMINRWLKRQNKQDKIYVFNTFFFTMI